VASAAVVAAIVIRTVIVAAIGYRAGTTRLIRLSVAGLSILGAWGWEIARDVFDAVVAVVAGSVHEIPDWSRFGAPLHVDGFGDILRLPLSFPGRAMATRTVVVAVLRHD